MVRDESRSAGSRQLCRVCPFVIRGIAAGRPLLSGCCGGVGLESVPAANRVCLRLHKLGSDWAFSGFHWLRAVPDGAGSAGHNYRDKADKWGIDEMI